MLYATLLLIFATGGYIAFSYYEAAKRRRALVAKRHQGSETLSPIRAL